jgi:hypothetical protein
MTFLTVKLGLVEALECAFALGDSDKARELLGIIEALRPGDRPPLLEAHAHRLRARLEGNEVGLEAATARFRQLDMAFYLAVTLLEHGEWLVRQDQPNRAQPLFAEASDIFERLEARPWLERVTAAARTQQLQVPA